MEPGVFGRVDKMVVYFDVMVRAAEGCYYYESC